MLIRRVVYWIGLVYFSLVFSLLVCLTVCALGLGLVCV